MLPFSWCTNFLLDCLGKSRGKCYCGAKEKNLNYRGGHLTAGVSLPYTPPPFPQCTSLATVP